MTESKKSNGDSSENRDSSAQPGSSYQRAPVWNLGRVLQYLIDASSGHGVSQRFTDYVSVILVFLCVVSLVAAIALPVPVSPQIRLLPLLFTVIAIVAYVINRLGIIVSLNARQAIIIWQIVVAAFWLGVTSAILVMMSCFYFLTQSGQ